MFLLLTHVVLEKKVFFGLEKLPLHFRNKLLDHTPNHRATQTKNNPTQIPPQARKKEKASPKKSSNAKEEAVEEQMKCKKFFETKKHSF